MTIQFGHWNFDGQRADERYFSAVRERIDAYEGDSTTEWSAGPLRLLCRHFKTTPDCDTPNPAITPSGTLITWDGRLDNREDLIRQLNGSRLHFESDLAIVCMAYERLGINALESLAGDWALTLWSPADRQLILAKDVIGTRQLYYRLTSKSVAWCTVL